MDEPAGKKNFVGSDQLAGETQLAPPPDALPDPKSDDGATSAATEAGRQRSLPRRELPEGWDAAARYHQMKKHLTERERQILGQRAIDEVVRRAREHLRHGARPLRKVDDTLPAMGELELERTLESPRPWRAQDIRIERVEPREAEVVAILDMSLSMTGEKIALVALATAILALKLDGVAVVAFDTTAHRLVRVGEKVAIHELVRRILEVPAQGFTNIEAGLQAALEELGRSQRRERAGILMSDGIHNLGADPARVAARFPRLHVVEVGPEDRHGTKNCIAMAAAGRGFRVRAPTYDALPEVTSRLVREIFR